jgi:hypothetical protein
LAGARELGSVVLDGELVAYAERPGWSSGRQTTDQPLPQTVRARRVDQGPLLRGHRRVRIDAHHHVWDLAVRDQPWTADIPALRRTFTFGQLRPQLADAGISATVLVQTITVTEETPEFLALAERLRPACDRAPTAGCHRRGAPGPELPAARSVAASSSPEIAATALVASPA